MRNIFVTLLFVCAPILSFAQSMGTFAVEAKPVDQYYRYNFGSVTVGQTMFADFTLTAKPTETLAIKRIVVRGMMYSGRTNCPEVLNPGQTCTTRIYFWPKSAGGHGGMLAFVLNDHKILIDLVGFGWQH